MKSSSRHFGFLTLPKYSMIALSGAIDVLRMANQLSGSQRYRWSTYSLNETAVFASNGITARPSKPFDLSDPLPDVLFVCGGWDVRDAVDARLKQLLSSLAERNVALGGLCTGAYALMACNLLNGYRCAVHWEALPEMHAEFPNVRFVEQIFVIDRDRLTCTGGTAPLDMMLHVVAEDLGPVMAMNISHQFSIEFIRSGSDPQPIPIPSRIGFSRAELVESVRLMEANIDEPLSVPELARLVGMSERQLQRVFMESIKTSPKQYYLGIRLKHARKLIRTSGIPISNVPQMCGFSTTTHFSHAFRSFFGYAPSDERRKRVSV